ncbi:transposase [Crossiella sp. CA198]|uniref:transposase n=1 Tax=Crossiella sp. CA198 TaxID=3455607 RepID=UPI003F8D8A0F
MAKKAQRYSAELKAEVVQLVLGTGRGYGEVAREFGLVPETVRTWVINEKRKNQGHTEQALEVTERARVTEMERRIRELEQENAFLKKAAAFFAKEQR